MGEKELFKEIEPLIREYFEYIKQELPDEWHNSRAQYQLERETKEYSNDREGEILQALDEEKGLSIRRKLIEELKQVREEKKLVKQKEIYDKVQAYIDNSKDKIAKELEEKEKVLIERYKEIKEIGKEKYIANNIKKSILAEGASKESKVYIVADEESKDVIRRYKEKNKKFKSAKKAVEKGKKKLSQLDDKYSGIDFTSENGIYGLFALIGREEEKDTIRMSDGIIFDRDKKMENINKGEIEDRFNITYSDGLEIELESKAEPKIDVQSEIKLEPKPETQQEVKSEPKPYVQPEVKVEPKIDVQPEVKAESKTDIQTKVKLEPKSETQPKVKSEQKPEQNKVAKNISIRFNAAENRYEVLDDLNNKNNYSRKELDQDSEKILKDIFEDRFIYDRTKISTEMVQVLDKYDKNYKNNKKNDYLKVVTALCSSKEQRKDLMDSAGITIEHDLRGIYNENISQEERRKLFENAKIDKQSGIGTVKKGFIVWIREKIDKVISLKDKLPRFTKKESQQLKAGEEDKTFIKENFNAMERFKYIVDEQKAQEVADEKVEIAKAEKSQEEQDIR